MQSLHATKMYAALDTSVSNARRRRRRATTLIASALALAVGHAFAQTSITPGSPLSISNPAAFFNGPITFIGNGTLTFTGSGTLASGIIFNPGALGTIVNGSGLTDILSGVLSGSGALLKQGSGTLTLTNFNSYVGGTFIGGGTLQVGNGGNAGFITGNVVNNATLVFNRVDNVPFNGDMSGTGALTKLGTGTLTLTGTNTHAGGTTISAGTLQIGNAGTTGSISGNVLNSGSLIFNRSDSTSFAGDMSGSGSLTKLGAGTLALTGNNTHTGGTTISAGTLQVGNGGTTGSIAGNVSVTNNAVLSFNRNDAVEFSGGISGSGALTKLGDGVLTLSGNNTHTGGTTISAGTLRVGNLVGNVTNNSILIFNNGSDVLFNGAISGTGALTKQGTGRLILNNTNTYLGGTTISAGTLEVGLSGSIVGNVNNDGVLLFSRSQVFGGSISGSGALRIGSDTVSLLLTGNNTHLGGTTISSGFLQVGNGGTTGSISGNVTNNGTMTFNRLDDIAFEGVISGAGALVKNGAGVLELTGNNTYTRGTTINAGTLQVGNGGTTGSIVGNVNNKSILTFNRSDNVTYTDLIEGSGALRQLGTGMLTLASDNNYTGGTTISAGTLQVGNGFGTGSIAGNVTNHGVLRFNRSDNVSFTGTISGPGSLSKWGAGTLTIGPATTSVGSINLAQGTLQLPTALAVRGITFESGVAANALTLSGTGAFTSLGNITNNSNSPQTINAPIIVGSAQTWDRGAGGLTVGGIIFNPGLAANALTLAGTGSFISLGNITNNSGNLQTINQRIQANADQTWDGGAAGLALSNASGNIQHTLTLQNNVTVTVQGTSPVVYGTSKAAALHITSGSRFDSLPPAIVGGATVGGLFGSTVSVSAGGSFTILTRDLTIGANGTLNVDDGGLAIVGGLLRINSVGQVNLNGGVLQVGTVDKRTGGQFNWTAGTLDLREPLVELGQHDLLGNVQTLETGKHLRVANTLGVGANFLLLSGGTVGAGTLTLGGGTVAAAPGASLDMDLVGTMSGHGSVNARVLNGTGKTINASGGALALGHLGSSSGFDYRGALNVGSNQVLLLSAAKAVLGSSTTLGDGGRLVTVNGADLAAGRTMSFTGNAAVQGNFTNNGSVSRTGPAGTLTFFNDVNGAGSFGGDIVFRAGFNPGNSPATVNHGGGDVTFDSTSVLTMEILGSAPGTQYDQLVGINRLTFNGRLALTFGNGFAPGPGSSFALFGFQSFAGSFAPDRIDVAGFDRARLDFSHLGQDGALSVAAVPEPGSYAMMLAGLGLIGVTAFRRRTARAA